MAVEQHRLSPNWLRSDDLLPDAWLSVLDSNHQRTSSPLAFVFHGCSLVLFVQAYNDVDRLCIGNAGFLPLFAQI